ncbi:hypothetical protein HZA87_01615 [Candidatus Uhrbacteria bacterium]|nr:hypothetical protein [Candidatus Uhrbacteria bacterium]
MDPFRSAAFFDKTGVLVITGWAFGAGHLFGRDGLGATWRDSWIVKGGDDEIERKWAHSGHKQEPMECLLYIDQFRWTMADPSRDSRYAWIGEEIASRQHGIHIPAEVFKTEWEEPSMATAMYPWRLRLRATSSFRLTPS